MGLVVVTQISRPLVATRQSPSLFVVSYPSGRSADARTFSTFSEMPFVSCITVGSVSHIPQSRVEYVRHRSAAFPVAVLTHQLRPSIPPVESFDTWSSKSLRFSAGIWSSPQARRFHPPPTARFYRWKKIFQESEKRISQGVAKNQRRYRYLNIEAGTLTPLYGAVGEGRPLNIHPGLLHLLPNL